MALSYGWGYTNSAAIADLNVAPVDLKEVTNYAVREDENGVTVLTNLTSPIDQAEIITIKAQTVKRVPTTQEVAYPAPVESGVQFSVKVEDILRITETTDVSFKQDVPFKATLTIMAGNSAAVTGTSVMQVVKRALGALYYSDGTSRIPALLKQATQPTKD